MIESPPKFEDILNALSLLNDEKIVCAINEINNEYLYWDKVKYKAKSLKVDPTVFWSAIKFNRSLNSIGLSFWEYKFRFSTTNYMQESLHYFDMNIGGNLGAQGIIPEQSKNQYLISSIMEEAIYSSKMEGASTTRKKAKDMLRKGTKPRNGSEYMIMNNFLTMEYIVEHKDEELTIEKLLFIHNLITKNTLENSEDEGCFRANDEVLVVDGITGETAHTPPEYIKIPFLIDELCIFFNKNDENKFIHPIVKAIIIHFMIGWIHPFADGNGRTARALFYWYMLKEGYWLTEFLSISRIIQNSKNQYEKAYLYTEHDQNDISYFIIYNLRAMKKAFEDLLLYIQNEQVKIRDVNKFVKLEGINERQAQILKLITENPSIVFNVREIENRFSVSNFTARMDLNGLVLMGYLEEVAVNKIKKNFIKSFLFDKLITKLS